MVFESNLVGNVLDPIHGAIRVTELERAVISHPLFQRLRSVKQNTFLYKVFPSAMHSRFEHSLGVMHTAYKMFSSLILNSHRYKIKYGEGLLFSDLASLPSQYIQELRLAALLHDVGHGPMSHQFDDFMMSKEELSSWVGNDFKDVVDLIKKGKKVEHEHISLIFIKEIFSDKKIDANVDNVLKIIEKDYLGGEIEYQGVNIQPLLTSLISSCPIDADRMDYMLRDSYFSGVKCGIYNVERLLMSMVPIIEDNKVYLGFKESSLDSISEFIFSRTNLFSQVYYHKTNRSFSAMLAQACGSIKDGLKDQSLFAMEGVSNISSLQDFYIKNTDEYFVNKTLVDLSKNNEKSIGMVELIKSRKPWKKIYEYKKYERGEINSSANKEVTDDIKAKIKRLLDDRGLKGVFLVDTVSDNAFKDIEKSEARLLVKGLDERYQAKPINLCGNVLDFYQSIRYFFRVFMDRDYTDKISEEIKELIEEICVDGFEKTQELRYSSE